MFVICTPLNSIILGIPWLKLHNPHIDWSTATIRNWSNHCHAHCLKSALPTRPTNPSPAPEEINLTNVPSDYHDLQQVFSKASASSLPPHRPYDCAIDLLPGATLPTKRLFHLAKPEREAMEKYITESVAAGLIRPSSSPVGAGFFFVEKKDKSLRPCIDYTGLNDITVKNKYPLPLIDSAFSPLHTATVFTKLDLRNAYHLIRIREGDKWKTAFNTPLGHFEYLVMPFGLTNAPAVFQCLVNDMLRDLLNKSVFVYLDDILIFSRSLEEHVGHVREVLKRLLENKLYAKAEKCEFHVSSVSFLGFVIEKGQLRADPSKVAAVKDWPMPTTREQLQRFLAFANFYRRFIRNYSRLAAPLTRLTSPKLTFVWSPDEQQAFEKLKNMFINTPVLTHPDPERQFVVEVDASDSGVGAILSQRHATDNKLHPCAFFSRRLSPAEANYDVGNRELLLVVLALQEWRHWLEGGTQPFTFHLRTARRLNSRQARGALFLSRFSFTITYRPGSRNTKPDALSPQFSSEEREPSRETVLDPECVLGEVHWPVEAEVREALQGQLVPDGCPVIGTLMGTHLPNSLPPRSPSHFSPHPTALLVAIHGGGRPDLCCGVHRVYTQQIFTQGPRRTPAAATHSPSSLVPHRCGLRYRAAPPEGNTTILTVVDCFSKAVHFVPLPKLPTALETANLLIQHVFRLHGIPQDIVSDRGPQFTSQVWKAFCWALGTTSSLTLGYHPQSNGQTERANQSLEASLSCVVSRLPSSWASHLPWVEYAHNSLVSAATGLSPFMVNHGYQPPLFPSQESDAAVPLVRAQFRRIRRVWWETRAALDRTAEHNRRLADRHRAPAPNYQVGQQVWLSSRDLPLQTDSRKLAPRYIGPYPVDKIINPCAVRLRLPASLNIHPVFHVSLLKPPPTSCATTAPPHLVEGHPAYTVNKILDVRRRGRGFQYLVDWEGYGPEERSWIGRALILDPQLLRDFYLRFPDKPGRRPLGGGGGTVMARVSRLLPHLQDRQAGAGRTLMSAEPLAHLQRITLIRRLLKLPSLCLR
uniref:ribonuclease H n=1 Tax=Takifugu rubripes TaxID=31033 RepID=A0A674NT72_TAKRU